MLVTSNHPAQCKMGKLKQSGVAACRRCKMFSEKFGRHYVYGHNRQKLVQIIVWRNVPVRNFMRVCVSGNLKKT
jgi:hypothetical protein